MVIASFTISVVTALVLKLLVDAIGGLEHRVSDWFKKHEGTAWKVGRILAVWGILFGSKFVILEVIDIIFGDSVELGGFLMIIAIIIALIVTRVVVFTIFRRLGDEGAA